MQIQKSKKNLHQVNDEIASAKALLNSYHMYVNAKGKSQNISITRYQDYRLLLVDLRTIIKNILIKSRRRLKKKKLISY